MPQTAKGWIDSSQFDASLQSLGASEVDGFLDFLFQDIARRPVQLPRGKTATVVRYLRLLALKGIPRRVLGRGGEALSKYYESADYERDRHIRPDAERLAKVLWGCLSDWGQIEPCTREEALRFLRQYSQTYMAGNPLLRPVLKLVEDFEVPPLQLNEPEPFRTPNFMSRSLAASGAGNPRLQVDLSERICAGFHCLKRLGVKKARSHLAQALNRAKVGRRTSDTEWADESVNERVKEFENRNKKEFCKTLGKQPSDERMAEWRDRLVSKWISTYRYNLDYPMRAETITRHVGWFCFDCNHIMLAVQDAALPTRCGSCSSQRVAVLAAALTDVAPAGDK
jgi:hypothetical protein